MLYSRTAIAAFAIVLTGSQAHAQAVCGNVESLPAINNVQIWKSGSAVGFHTPALQVDADGAPDSYRVDGNGLSYTCDGLSAIVKGVPQTRHNNKENWQALCRDGWKEALRTNDYSKLRIFGFLVDRNNRPIVQGAGDPLPGEAFITTTSVTIPGASDKTQRRYVNANEIPYVVLPERFTRQHKVANGALVVIYWPARNKYAFAVYGDGGRLGEASVRLHQDIGNNPIIVRDGVRRAKRSIEGKVLTLVFPGEVPKIDADYDKWRNNITAVGNATLKKWGGVKKLEECAK